MRTTPVAARMKGLQPALLTDAADAGDAQGDHDLDLEAAVETKFALHPITGTFADASHESEFAALLFRRSFPIHVSLLSLLIAGSIVYITVNSPPEMRASWVIISLCMTLGLVGRVLIHRKQGSVTRGQRMGAWAWMALLGLVGALGVIVVRLSRHGAACPPSKNPPPAFLFALADLAGVLLNGSHGMGFVRKSALIGCMLICRFCMHAICEHHSSIGPMGSMMLVIAAGFLVTHIAELRLRYSYVEKVREKQAAASQIRRLEEEKRHMKEKEQFDEEDKRRLEERNEQLKAEKERLLYDVHCRGQPLDDDNRSVIRRGLQAGPANSPPPSLPPGAPSSTAGSSTDAPLAWEEAVRQWHAENAARSASVQAAIGTLAPGERQDCTLDASGAACNAAALSAHSTLSAAEASSLCRNLPELAAELVAADVQSQAAKKEAAEAAEAAQAAKAAERDMSRAPLSELGTAPLTWDETKCRWITPSPEVSWRSEMTEATPGLESSESLELNPHGQGQVGLAEMAEMAELADEKAVAELHNILSPAQGWPVGSPAQGVHAHAMGVQYCEAAPPPPQVNGTAKLTPKQALHLARHRIQFADTDAKVYEVVRALAMALGASRPEAGTIRALHAVLIQLAWPGTSNTEACTFTDASMSNFARWRRRVAKAETAPVYAQVAEMVQIAQ